MTGTPPNGGFFSLAESARYSATCRLRLSSCTSRRPALLHRRDRHDEAEVHIREILRTDPDHSRAHYALGLIMQAQGDVEQARQHFAAAGPSDAGNPDTGHTQTWGIGTRLAVDLYEQR